MILYHRVLPTAKRAAFINSVSYHQSKEGVLLATLFHQGSIAHINQKTGEIAVVMDGLKILTEVGNRQMF